MRVCYRPKCPLMVVCYLCTLSAFTVSHKRHKQKKPKKIFVMTGFSCCLASNRNHCCWIKKQNSIYHRVTSGKKIYIQGFVLQFSETKYDMNINVDCILICMTFKGGTFFPSVPFLSLFLVSSLS